MLINVINSDQFNEWHGTTPGEEAHFNPNFAQATYDFCKRNDINTNLKYTKVRIVAESGRFNIEDAWWKDKQWQEETLWCYQTPVKLFHKGDPLNPYLCYALEMMECERIRLTEIERIGYSKFAIGDSLIVPTDCCEQCCDETSAGVSDHVRERPKVDDVKDPDLQDEHLPTAKKILNLKTNQDREEEAELNERAAEIEKEIMDVSDDPKWDKEVKSGVLH